MEVDPTRLFLRNLSYSVTKEEIEAYFSSYGAIEEVTLPMDTQNHRPKGFAYVKFATTESAVVAFDKLDRSVFQGRLLHIIPAKKKPEVVVESKAPTSYKKTLMNKLKEKGKNSNTWNTLFLNPDTVASAMSNKLHVTKGEFMDTEDLAVKISMAETKIIQEIKAWMEIQGISYESFNSAKDTAPRSQNVIIVKNLAPNSSLSDLQDIFSRYGALGRCCMPPSKTVAIIEYVDAQAAHNAFNQAVYTTYKSLPLYLEWAPLNTFEAEYVKPVEVVKTNSNTLFVKNLSFDTTQKGLEEHMKSAGEIKSIRIITNQGLPSGYGFVEYATEKAASKALRNLNNSILDGHSLKLSESKTTVQIPQKRSKKVDQITEIKEEDNRTKILVKNLAFEATKHELKNLFGNFGEVKSVRIPTKVGGTHRGFGFVELLTHDDAERAIDSLQNTHLYGRRLVLEWAQVEESMSSIRKKQHLIDN